MVDVPVDLEQKLASMSEAEWAAFTAKVRAPDRAEAFRTAASKYIDGDRLEALCGVANLAAFTDANGEIDETKVEQRLRAAFGLPKGPRWANQGQYTEAPPQPAPGDRGNAEARKRFGGPQPRNGRGRAGTAEAERRFGKRPS